MNRLTRTAVTLLSLAGLIGATASMQTTSASWNDRTNFAAAVSSGNWGTVPPPPPPVGEGGISPGNPDTVIHDIVWSISGARQFCTEVQVRGASSTPRPWAIDIDLTQAPFNGVTANQVSLNGTGTLTIINQQAVRITGRSHGGGWDPRTNNTPITSAQTALLTICIYNSPVPPPAHPSWYTVSTTQGTWTSTQACVITTITTTRNDFATNPFFYGWTTELNLTAAKARITSAGNTLNFVSWSPYPNGDTDMFATPATYNPPLDAYTVRSGFSMALRASGGGANSRTFTACVNGYSTNGNGNGNGNGGNNRSAVPTMATPSVESTGAEPEESGPAASAKSNPTTTVPATTIAGSSSTASSTVAPVGSGASTTVASTSTPPTSGPTTSSPAAVPSATPASTSSTVASSPEVVDLEET